MAYARPMCGRYSITTPVEAMAKIFGFSGLPNLGPNYNVAPTNAVPFVRLENKERQIAMARWGLVPSWAKEIRNKPLINVRGETIDEKPAFRSSFKRRRCLVPADGFYEWQKREQGPKQPYYIHRHDGEIFGMAAIWDHWIAPDANEIDSLAIVTTSANKLIGQLHTRMPVILDESDFSFWLDPKNEDFPTLKEMLKPAKEDLLEAYPVTTQVNRVGQEGADLVEPIGPRLGNKPQETEEETKSQDPQMKLL